MAIIVVKKEKRVYPVLLVVKKTTTAWSNCQVVFAKPVKMALNLMKMAFVFQLPLAVEKNIVLRQTTMKDLKKSVVNGLVVKMARRISQFIRHMKVVVVKAVKER